MRHLNESNLTDFQTCTEGKSRGSLYVTLAAMPLSVPQGASLCRREAGRRNKKARGARYIAIFIGISSGSLHGGERFCNV